MQTPSFYRFHEVRFGCDVLVNMTEVTIVRQSDLFENALELSDSNGEVIAQVAATFDEVARVLSVYRSM